MVNKNIDSDDEVDDEDDDDDDDNNRGERRYDFNIVSTEQLEAMKRGHTDVLKIQNVFV